MVEIETEVTIDCPLCGGDGTVSHLDLESPLNQGYPAMTKKERMELKTDGCWTCPACHGQGTVTGWADVEIEPGDLKP